MRNHTFLLLCLSILLAACSFKNNTTKKQKKVIIGYVYGGNNIDWEGFDANKFTHINYAFANIIDGKMAFELESDYPNLERLINSKKDNPALKILVSVGGWTWSGDFSDMALTKESREIFINSCLEEIRKTNIDGIDLDWEYPGQKGLNNVHRPEDKQNFTMLLQELRNALDKEAEKGNRKDAFLLTIAAGANQTYLNKTEMDIASKSLDYINLMTYDFYTGADSISGHHANLFAHKDDPNGNSCHTAIQQFIKAGVPKEKIVMGIPFYNRFFGKITTHNNNGQYQPFITDTSLRYSKILNAIEKDSFPKFFDEESKSAYRWNAEKGWFMSVEDTAVIQLKAKYIKDNDLAGAMFWAYSKRKNDLLNTLNTAFNTNQ
jgi:chitinase